MNFNVLKSKTFWGALLAAVATVLMDPTPEKVLQALGGILAAVGVRDAIAKVEKKQDEVS